MALVLMTTSETETAQVRGTQQLEWYVRTRLLSSARELPCLSSARGAAWLLPAPHLGVSACAMLAGTHGLEESEGGQLFARIGAALLARRNSLHRSDRRNACSLAAMIFCFQGTGRQGKHLISVSPGDRRSASSRALLLFPGSSALYH